MKVLIVEDDVAISDMYQMKCSMTGITALTAGNGEEALKVLKTFTPDVILLDIQMPVMNGAEFLRIFHADAANKNTPVLILTNTGAEEAPQEMWGAGIAGYIIKANTTPSEVIAKIKELVKPNA